MTEICCQKPPASTPTLLAIAAENALEGLFGETRKADSLETAGSEMRLPVASWRKLLRQIEQLDAASAEALSILEEPLSVLEPSPTEAGVINLTLDGKRDEFIGVTNLSAAIAALANMQARQRMPLDNESAQLLLDLLTQAEQTGQRVWIWQPVD